MEYSLKRVGRRGVRFPPCVSTDDCAVASDPPFEGESPICVGGMCVTKERLEMRDCLFHRSGENAPATEHHV